MKQCSQHLKTSKKITMRAVQYPPTETPQSIAVTFYWYHMKNWLTLPAHTLQFHSLFPTHGTGTL